jgi:hypothetical protein
MGRPLTRTYPLDSPYNHVTPIYTLATGGNAPLNLPGGNRPLMRTGKGGYIPAAQDPSDPATWMVAVVFT